MASIAGCLLLVALAVAIAVSVAVAAVAVAVAVAVAPGSCWILAPGSCWIPALAPAPRSGSWLLVSYIGGMQLGPPMQSTANCVTAFMQSCSHGTPSERDDARGSSAGPVPGEAHDQRIPIE